MLNKEKKEQQKNMKNHLKCYFKKLIGGRIPPPNFTNFNQSILKLLNLLLKIPWRIEFSMIVVKERS